MRVLADYHHSDLFESLALLFEDRYGWELFRPAGMEWFDEGYWNFERKFHGDAVAKQYLAIWKDDRYAGDHFRRDDTTHPGRILKGVTLEQARSQSWDIVLCTISHNESGFARFAAEVGAHYGIQAGNVGQIANVAVEGAGWGPTEFVLASTTFDVPIPVPYVIYRQEFSLHDFRFEWPPVESKSVASFVQCFAENRGMERGGFYDEFEHLALTYPEFDWKVYGAYGTQPEDQWACGNLPSTPDVAAHMRASWALWHAKFWSDGYGHVVHNIHAVGRPIFSYHNYYADKLAGPLMEHGVTGFDLNRMDEAEIMATLRRLREPEYHQQISVATAARFREIVNFDEDAEKVRALLESIL